MARIPLRLDELVDGAALRRDLAALTDAPHGDGSAPAVRAAVLRLLKERLGEGRRVAEGMLMQDGGGRACAARLSHLMDELIRALHDFAVTHVYRARNPSAAERMAIVAVGGCCPGTLAPGSDIDLLFLLPYKQTPWGGRVV
ncbi:MAG TPA: bifunctional uridylyltransferase/uridylyl-removing protein, partial [Mesorhizobium sp.]|nr:bifunctional uridylyltransferase/uridylyl-removing protein [Mesorhizobium sp.]